MLPKILRFRALGLLSLIALAAGCDSPIELDSHPNGVVFLRADGSEAARFVYQQGATGALTVGIGATQTYRIRALTEEGEVVPLDGVEYSISQPRLVIALAATLSLSAADQLVITGGPTARNTTLFFDLQHGSHPEFRVEDVVVSIQ